LTGDAIGAQAALVDLDDTRPVTGEEQLLLQRLEGLCVVRAAVSRVLLTHQSMRISAFIDRRVSDLDENRLRATSNLTRFFDALAAFDAAPG
jgi:hypothetical protein